MREKLIELLLNMPGYLLGADGLADHLIANGVTIQKWIPVTERLPEVVDSYLVVVKCKYDWEKEYDIDVDVATYNPYEKAYIDDCWNTYNDWNEGQQYIHVTHWMPLPEPPKAV
jgi:hypothetical protein